MYEYTGYVGNSTHRYGYVRTYGKLYTYIWLCEYIWEIMHINMAMCVYIYR